MEKSNSETEARKHEIPTYTVNTIETAQGLIEYYFLASGRHPIGISRSIIDESNIISSLENIRSTGSVLGNPTFHA